MLALYVLVGTGVLVWLWLVWDMTREARAKRARRSAQPLAAGPTASEAPEPKARSGAAPKPAPKVKGATKRRPIQKVSYTRHRKKPPPKPAPEQEAAPEAPPKPARDPREWMDEDYD